MHQFRWLVSTKHAEDQEPFDLLSIKKTNSHRPFATCTGVCTLLRIACELTLTFSTSKLACSSMCSSLFDRMEGDGFRIFFCSKGFASASIPMAGKQKQKDDKFGQPQLR